MEFHDWMLWEIGFDVPGTTHKRAFFSIHVAAENAQTACQLAEKWNSGIEEDGPDIEIVSVKLVDTFLVRPPTQQQKQSPPIEGIENDHHHP